MQEEPYASLHADVAVMVPSAIPVSSSSFLGYINVRCWGLRVCKAIGALRLRVCNVIQTCFQRVA